MNKSELYNSFFPRQKARFSSLFVSPRFIAVTQSFSSTTLVEGECVTSPKSVFVGGNFSPGLYDGVSVQMTKNDKTRVDWRGD